MRFDASSKATTHAHTHRFYIKERFFNGNVHFVSSLNAMSKGLLLIVSAVPTKQAIHQNVFKKEIVEHGA